MPAKKLILLMFVSLVLCALILPAYTSANAQSSTICGYFKDEGYYFLSFYLPNNQYIVTGYTVDDVKSIFGINPATETGRLEITNPVMNRSGAMTGYSSFRRVSSCSSSTPANIKPGPINVILPMAGECVSKVALSIDKTNMPIDWQQAIASAGQTWAKAGSNLKFSQTAVSDSQRTLTALDYDGSPITINNQPLTLAQCEIRVFRASSLPGKYIVSFEKGLAKINVKDPYTSKLAGWSQPFSIDGKSANAVLIILNDRNAPLLLTTNPSVANLDLESIVLHELGHALGLNHAQAFGPVMSNDKYDHLMNLAGFKKRALQQSDLDALFTLYGREITSKFPGYMYLTSPRMHSENIKMVQQRLSTLGYSEVGTPDSWFGPGTESAVRHFQRNNRLSEDGVVDSVMWNLLFP